MKIWRLTKNKRESEKKLKNFRFFIIQFPMFGLCRCSQNLYLFRMLHIIALKKEVHSLLLLVTVAVVKYLFFAFGWFQAYSQPFVFSCLEIIGSKRGDCFFHSFHFISLLFFVQSSEIDVCDNLKMPKIYWDIQVRDMSYAPIPIPMLKRKKKKWQNISIHTDTEIHFDPHLLIN